mgnify:CR=1 FL=1
MVAAALAFALGEGLVAAKVSGWTSLGDWLQVFSFAISWMLPPLLVLALLLAEIFNRPPTRRMGTSLRVLLGWKGPGGSVCAAFLGIVVVILGIVGGGVLGRVLLANMSPRFAALGIAVGTTFLLMGFFVLATQVAAWASSLLAPAFRGVSSRKSRRVFSLLVMSAGGVVFAGLKLWLPQSYAVAPSLSVVVFGLALWPAVHVALVLVFRRWRGHMVVGFIFVICFFLSRGLERASIPAQSASFCFGCCPNKYSHPTPYPDHPKQVRWRTGRWVASYYFHLRNARNPRV